MTCTIHIAPHTHTHPSPPPPPSVPPPIPLSLSLSLSLSSSILLFLGPGALCKVLQQMTGLAHWRGRAQRRPKHMLTDRLLFQQISHSKRIKKPAIFPTAG